MSRSQYDAAQTRLDFRFGVCERDPGSQLAEDLQEKRRRIGAGLRHERSSGASPSLERYRLISSVQKETLASRFAMPEALTEPASVGAVGEAAQPSVVNTRLTVPASLKKRRRRRESAGSILKRKAHGRHCHRRKTQSLIRFGHSR